MKKIIKLTVALLLFPLLLSSCSNNYKKPDNDLKKSPCACLGVVYNSKSWLL